MAYSAAIAVAVGEELGLSTEEITRGAASYEPAGSRMRVLRLRDGRLVLDDCYNANPQSVTASLEILAKTECGRKVAVLGDMGELGDLTDQAHYNMGALAAMLGIERWWPSAPRRRRSPTARPERRFRHPFCHQGGGRPRID